MKERYIFGIMLERLDDKEGHGQIFVKGKWVPVMVFWRVFSARLHGPLMLTPASAFFAWLKNWITDCVRTKRRHIAD